MLYRGALVIAIFLVRLAWAAPPAAPKAESVEAKRRHVVQVLKKQKYFRDASCTEVANSVLKKIGLPPLWRPGLIKGRRGTVARPPKPQEPPLFSDEITPPGKTPIKVQIQTRLLNPPSTKLWRLHIKRSGEVKLKSGTTPVTLDTDFDFDVPKPGRCELTAIDFKMVNTPADRKVKPEEVKIRECIDLFFVSPKKPPQELRWIQADCAMALKYSPEARRMAP